MLRSLSGAGGVNSAPGAAPPVPSLSVLSEAARGVRRSRAQPARERKARLSGRCSFGALEGWPSSQPAWWGEAFELAAEHCERYSSTECGLPQARKGT